MNTPEISAKEKETYVRAIFMNTLFLIGCALILEFFAFANYTEISTKTDAANAATAKIEKYKTEGVTISEYKTFLSNAKKPSLSEIQVDIFSEALKKDTNSPLDYISWVESEVSSGSADRYAAVEQKNDAIIGNILPTLGEVNTLGEANAPDALEIQSNIVTLPTLTKYVEESILKKFSLDSISPISIGDINFDSTKNTTTNIGSFVINMEVTGKNANILSAIAAIQDSGKLSIENGELITQVPAKTNGIYSNLSNLLVGIDSVDTKNALDHSSDTNSATLKLRFYVKGRSYGSYLDIKNTVTAKFNKLKADITTTLAKYKTQPPKTNAQIEAVSDIRNLSAQVSAISTKIDEIQKSGKITDYAQQFDSILSVYVSLKAIQVRFDRDILILK